jgi:hypothetical protein
MPTVLQFRRGTTAQNNSFTGAAGELSIDTDLDVVRVHDGSTQGGFPMIGANAAQTLTNKTLSAAIIINGILNGDANGVGNIGNATTFFNTVFAKATSAQYADVAELYRADTEYQPGTVLEIGGPAEVTATTEMASQRIAGVVSTNPAFIMNNVPNSVGMVQVALLGRVPCLVTGTVRRGDLLCSSVVSGYAMAMPADRYRPGAVIGKALEDHAGDGIGTIEIMIGRL